MKKKITFNFEEIKEFIDDVEEDHYGRCGDKYYTRYRLTEEGTIEYQNYSFSIHIEDESWHKLEIKGKIEKEE